MITEKKGMRGRGVREQYKTFAPTHKKARFVRFPTAVFSPPAFGSGSRNKSFPFVSRNFEECIFFIIIIILFQSWFSAP